MQVKLYAPHTHVRISEFSFYNLQLLCSRDASYEILKSDGRNKVERNSNELETVYSAF